MPGKEFKDYRFGNLRNEFLKLISHGKKFKDRLGLCVNSSSWKYSSSWKFNLPSAFFFLLLLTNFVYEFLYQYHH